MLSSLKIILQVLHYLLYVIAANLTCGYYRHLKTIMFFLHSYLACLHDQNKSGFLEGLLLSGQSQQFKKYSKSSDWLEKSRPSKKATFVLIM